MISKQQSIYGGICTTSERIPRGLHGEGARNACLVSIPWSCLICAQCEGLNL